MLAQLAGASFTDLQKWSLLVGSLASCLQPESVTHSELQRALSWVHDEKDKYRSLNALLTWSSGKLMLAPAAEKLLP